MSNLGQDVSVTNADQASTEEQDYRETMHVLHTWAGHIYRTFIQLPLVLRINPLLHSNNNYWVKLVLTSQQMTGFAGKWTV